MAKIAYIDDNQGFLEIVKDYLEKHHYEVDVFGCAVDFCNKHREKMDYDLIISDFDMPMITGQDFFEIVHERFPEAKTILFSAQIEKIKVEESIHVDCFISKLQPIEKLEKTINFLLKGKKEINKKAA